MFVELAVSLRHAVAGLLAVLVVAILAAVHAQAAPVARANSAKPCPRRGFDSGRKALFLRRFERLTAVVAYHEEDGGGVDRPYVCVNRTGRRIPLQDDFESVTGVYDAKTHHYRGGHIDRYSVVASKLFMAYTADDADADNEYEYVVWLDARTGFATPVSDFYTLGNGGAIAIKRLALLPNGAVAWLIQDRIVACDTRCLSAIRSCSVHCPAPNTVPSVVVQAHDLDRTSLATKGNRITWLQAGRRHYRRLR